MEGQSMTYKDPDFICGCEVVKRVGEARPLYTYLIRNPVNTDDRAVAKVFDLDGLSAFGLSKLGATYFVSDVLDFLELGLPGALRQKEGVRVETNTICFDHMEARTLYELVKSEGVLSDSDTLDISRRLALILGEAEREGFFHLALNPRNVFISKEGALTIKDWVLSEQNVALFSIPQRLEHDPYYFQAPELLDMKGISSRADIYSLGLMAGFMSTGDWKIKEAIGNGADISAQLRARIRGFISEDPAERIAGWEEAAAILAAGITVPAATSGTSLRKKARLAALPKRGAAVAIAIIAAIAVLGLILVLRPLFQDRSTYSSRAGVMLVPSCVGMSFDDASARAGEMGILCEKNEEHCDEAAAGIVIAQDPGADSEVAEGILLKLTVSLGPEAEAVAGGGGEAAGSTASDAAGGGASDSAAATPAPAPEPQPPAGSKPVVSASASPGRGPSSGTMVTLSASAYDPDGGSIVSYAWSCGGSGPSISREFASNTAPQTITVSVTVTDDEGETATASVSIYLY